MLKMQFTYVKYPLFCPNFSHWENLWIIPPISVVTLQCQLTIIQILLIKKQSWKQLMKKIQQLLRSTIPPDMLTPHTLLRIIRIILLLLMLLL